MLLVERCLSETHDNIHEGGGTPVVSRSFERHTDDSTICLGSIPVLKNPLEVVRASHLFSPSTNLMRGLAARRLFRAPPCRKDTIFLQPSTSSPGFKPRLNSQRH
ncbi:hypothetical protein TNCV_4171141 [Trichonephila clavipes]|nr:hypothetical protein TNCV_4171141 [Trichonephila clavipes]